MTCWGELGGSPLTEPSSPARRAARRTASAVVGVVLLVALLVLVTAYLARKAIAREIITGWLRGQGVAAQVEIADLGLGRAAGRIRVGDGNAPDLTIGDATVAYRLRGLGFEVAEVTVIRPVVRARLQGATLSLGSLDRLIEALKRRPPRPDQAEPRVRVEQGVVLLATDYGPLRLTGDAAVEAGRLTGLKAKVDAARLHGPAFDLSLGPTAITLTTAGARTALTADAPLEHLRVRKLAIRGARLQLMADAPYPDLKRRRVAGPLTLRVEVTGANLASGLDRLDDTRAVATFAGQLSGAIEDLAASGHVTIDAGGGTAAAGAARLGAWRANLQAADLRWTRKGGEALSATPHASFAAQALAAGDLRVAALSASAKGPLAYGRDGLRGSLLGDVAGDGSWRGLGPVKASDTPDVSAVKRAAQAFRLAAPAMRIELAAGGVQLALPQPARLLTAGGGQVTLAARGGAPVLGADGGAFRLAVQGGGLPSLEADVRRLRLADGGLTAQGQAKARGTFGPAEDATAQVSGLVRARDGALSFDADGCAQVAAGKIELGANDIDRLSGRLCPSGGPLFTVAGGGWRLKARVEGLAAEVPFLQARVAQGEGTLAAAQVSGRLGVTAALTGANVADTAPKRRFEPVRMAATAALADGRWTAELGVETPAGQALGRANLRHDTGDGRGGLTFDTGLLVFAQHGLQPAQLSPAAAALASPVEGRAQFVGHVDWTKDGAVSGGTLSVPGLDFQSAAGKVSGLSGVIAFDSLAPLTTAPGQTLAARSIAAIVPITDVTAAVGLDEKALTITGGQAAVGGGQVRIETLKAPLAPDAPMTGVLVLDGVQLHDLIEASPFGDRVDLDARVSGRVPFENRAGKVRIAQAELHAVQPGRLSIARQALTGVAAAGSVAAPSGAAVAVPPTDTFTDFAYQAMENLAFQTLNATVASRDDGRLGVLAHIVGRHDPPKRQEIRLSIFDLIGRKFLNKPLPLPSDTGVDLTLDTTLNLDDLLADYADYRQLRGSPPVQPAGPTTATRPTETPR